MIKLEKGIERAKNVAPNECFSYWGNKWAPFPPEVSFVNGTVSKHRKSQKPTEKGWDIANRGTSGTNFLDGVDIAVGRRHANSAIYKVRDFLYNNQH